MNQKNDDLTLKLITFRSRETMTSLDQDYNVGEECKFFTTLFSSTHVCMCTHTLIWEHAAVAQFSSQPHLTPHNTEIGGGQRVQFESHAFIYCLGNASC